MASPNLASAVFVVREVLDDPANYDEKLNEIMRMPFEERLKLTGKTAYQWSYDDAFSDDAVWNEAELSPDANIVNRIYNSLFSVKGQLGKTLRMLMDDYSNGVMREEQMARVDAIRKTVSINPRVIVLTTDNREYAIYDGWHTALAFALEGKSIPAYVGFKESFLCYK